MDKTMIQANELRLGNYVEYWRSGIKHIIQIDSIHPKGVNFEWEVIDGDDLSQLMPIPLTEQWLLKFGFVYDGYIYRLSPNAVVGSDLSWIGVYSERQDDDVTYDCPKTVHQLQNLYFALTGEELEKKS